MVNRKPTPEKERKRHIFQFSFRSLFLLSIGVFFVLGWVFFLGILVGRGLLPNSIENFSFIKKKIVKDETEKKNEHVSPIKIDELSFYNHLIDKKEEAKKKAPPATLSKNQVKKIEKTKLGQLKQEIRSYNIQVAALKDKAKTEKMVERLTRLGYQAYYYQILINGEMYYRIRCGPFSTIEKAKQYAKRLANKEGFKPFIVYPNNE
ncbi:MAG TPA: SPOR domain-containing protein [Desulfatiglandales bacterium]|nr:SPOR domain-containing protein [Desulfatiglandales bacterium]